MRAISVFNPKSNLPEKFEYVDLESVVGTTMTHHSLKTSSNAPSRAQRLAKYNDIFFQTVRPYQQNNYLFELPYNNYIFSTGYAQIRASIDPYFLFSRLQESTFVKDVLDHCTGTGYPSINSKDLSNIKVGISLSNYENKKIGKLIKLLDIIIDLQQRKIELYSSLKKGLLQKIFTLNNEDIPKIRFTNFYSKWNHYKLGNLGTSYSGLSGKNKNDFGHGTAKYIPYVNIFSNAVTDTNDLDLIELDPSQNEVTFGDIMFTVSSETPEEVGMSSVWLGNSNNVYLNSFCFGFSPVVQMDSYYLAFMFRSPVVRKKFMLLAQGISRYNISKNKVMNMEIPLPSLDEQKNIGKVLTNLSDIISKNKLKLDQLKDMKKYFLSKLFI